MNPAGFTHELGVLCSASLTNGKTGCDRNVPAAARLGAPGGVSLVPPWHTK